MDPGEHKPRDHWSSPGLWLSHSTHKPLDNAPPNLVFQSVKALAALSQKAGVASQTLSYSARHLDDLELFYYILLYLCILYTVAEL